MGKALTVKRPEPAHGPKFAALNERQQRFVDALLQQTKENFADAARAAGYSDKGVSAITHGHRLSRDPKVLAAIHEEAEKRIRGGGILAANVLVAIASDPLHKDRLKAAQALLASGGLGPIALNRTTVEHTVTDEAMLARVQVLAGVLGLDSAKLLGRVRGVPVPKAPVRDPSDEPGEVSDAEFRELDEWDEVIDGTVQEDASSGLPPGVPEGASEEPVDGGRVECSPDGGASEAGSAELRGPEELRPNPPTPTPTRRYHDYTEQD